MGAPVVHFEIGVSELSSAAPFYEALFDWAIARDDRGYGLVQTGSGIGIGGGLLETPDGVPPYVTVYVQVDDLDKYLIQTEELGGKRIMEPMPIEGVGSFAMVADPDGNAIGLLQPSTPED